MTLTCHASGLPQPTFTWITPDGHAVNATAPVYESEVLDDGSENRRGKILQEDGSILIFNTRVVDQGVYKCLAMNINGEDNKTVNLTVKKGKNKMGLLNYIKKCKNKNRFQEFNLLKVVILIVMLTIPSIDLVEVEVAITIEDEVFHKDLKKKSSIKYKTIEKQVKQEVRQNEHRGGFLKLGTRKN